MLTDGATDADAARIGEHFRYLQALMQQGIVIVAGRTLNKDDECFGIVIFRADSEEAARSIMENDPAVSNGVMSSRLFPYRVAMVCAENALV